ncbi:MAG: carbohydrate porin, partial [Bdellovibrionaceae bacterium]|nr:carbohydrate porin [Pseudobdellovibrionaceae bacterium]
MKTNKFPPMYFTLCLLLTLPTFSKAESTTDFHGYVRSSLSMSQNGNSQAVFQAPGAQSKYRLGNESDTDIELAIDHRSKLKLTDDEWVDTQFFFMVDGYKTQGDSSDMSLSGVPQFYIKFLNMGSQKMNFWVGRRYYDRLSIHMNDHFWLNAGQGAHIGAGLDDWSLGNGNLNLALFRYEDKDVDGLGSQSTVKGLLNSTALDARYKALKLNENTQINFWLNLTSRHKNESLNYDTKNGYGLGLWLESEKLFEGSNTFVATYRKGAAMVQGLFNARPIR